MSKETGGPAFPASYYTDDGEWAKRDGMTLRDYFAAKAMQGLLADHSNNMYIEDLVKLAYEYADAMLKARKQ